MTAENKPPYVDTQELNDTDTHVYETVITLEFLGRPATKKELASAVGMDDRTLEESLDALTGRGAIVESRSGDVPAFVPARRDWSATPDRPSPGP
jgi:Holliday junction resolvasome RuvABC ATP-dependent DNA helicase subunit